jgi:hypothetical protein
MIMIATQPMNETSRRTAIRVPIAQPDDLYARALAKYARRTYGDVPDNVLVLLKHRPALKALRASRAASRSSTGSMATSSPSP